MSRFGTLFFKARLLAGATAEEWAAILGVTRDTIWRWERGDSRPAIKRIPKVIKLVSNYLDKPDMEAIYDSLLEIGRRHALREDR
ncbi:MAG: helix-turn-helix transcriptional regulator [Candidatus Caldarchaeum sp.]